MGNGTKTQDISPAFEDKTFRVLVVDDDNRSRAYYAEMLEKYGDYDFVIDKAASLDEARHIIQMHGAQLDCVVLDVLLHDDNSHKWLPDALAGDDAPAMVMLTQQVNDEQAADIFALGAADYVNKDSVSAPLLARSIRFAIERMGTKRLSSQLEHEREQNRLQRQFISLMTHEFRTPLAVIDSSAQLLKKTILPDNDNALKHLKKIRASVTRINGLIDKTLQLSRHEDGKIKLELSTFDVKRTIHSEIVKLQDVYPQRRLHIDSDRAPAFEIKSDKRLFSQIITNIIINAIKFSDVDKLIDIYCSHELKHVNVRVRDYGMGIPQAELKDIGQKFFRASNTRQVPGTGIGLYLVQTWMQWLEGSISVESQENKGTSVTLTFPLAIQESVIRN